MRCEARCCGLWQFGGLGRAGRRLTGMGVPWVVPSSAPITKAEGPLGWLATMRRRGIRPDEQAFATATNTCGARRDWRAAMWLWGDMAGRAMQPGRPERMAHTCQAPNWTCIDLCHTAGTLLARHRGHHHHHHHHHHHLTGSHPVGRSSEGWWHMLSRQLQPGGAAERLRRRAALERGLGPGADEPHRGERGAGGLREGLGLACGAAMPLGHAASRAGARPHHP